MEVQPVWKEWEQMEEERQDYQYFKIKDQEQLSQTLEALKKLGVDKNQEV